MMETIFITLYPLAAFCHVAAYLPQIKALAVNKSDVTVMPLLPWIVWLVGNFVTLGYAVFHLKDLMLSMTVSLTAVFISAIIALIVYNRSKYSAPKNTEDDIWNAAV